MPEALTDEEHRVFAQINQDYIRLSNELRNLQQQQINELSLVLSVQEQINQQISSSKALFNKHLLWLPNLNPVDSRWASDVIAGSAELLHQLPALLWQQVRLILSQITPALIILLLTLLPAECYIAICSKIRPAGASRSVMSAMIVSATPLSHCCTVPWPCCLCPHCSGYAPAPSKKAQPFSHWRQPFRLRPLLPGSISV